MANMSLDDMKDTFLLSGGHDISYEMLDYIQNTLGITESGLWNFIGYDVICVDPKEYERVLLAGKKYAIEKDYGMWWVNKYNERRSPIASMDIGIGLLPETMLEGEIRYNDRESWVYEEYTPAVVNDYLKLMQEYLGEEIIRISKDYIPKDNALRITSVTSDIDYKKYKSLLEKFIYENGYGPFTEIHPLTFTGGYVKKPFQVKKR